MSVGVRGGGWHFANYFNRPFLPLVNTLKRIVRLKLDPKVAYAAAYMVGASAVAREP